MSGEMIEYAPKLTKRQREALSMLQKQREQCSPQNIGKDGYAEGYLSSSTYWDQVGPIPIHWRTARSLELKGLIYLGAKWNDGDGGWSQDIFLSPHPSPTQERSQ